MYIEFFTLKIEKSMNEEFLYFIWQHGLMKEENLVTTNNEKIEILDMGTRNSASGPDFSNAKIKINNTLWCGNVEIHVKSSDWLRHKHFNDKAYDNVVLHAVYNADAEIKNSHSQVIPTMEIPVESNLLENYKHLAEDNSKWIPCQEEWGSMNSLRLTSLLEKMLFNRLERKSENILEMLAFESNSWESAFYKHLSSVFGLSENALAFEILSESVPLQIVNKHKNSILQIEAMFFGQAGMLNEKYDSDYYTSLQKEYKYLRHKFRLTPLEPHIWKFGGVRPVNFPTIRISQFSNLINQSSFLFSKILEYESVSELSKLFKVTASDFWRNHYSFSKQSEKESVKRLGESKINNILINCVIPFIFAYGHYHKNADMKDKAVRLLEQVSAENNSIIKNWKSMGVGVENAFFSQALIELKKEYCNFRRCLTCDVGYKLLKDSWMSEKN